MKQNIYDREDFYNAYLNLRKSGAGINESLEQPTVRSLLPTLDGLKILDLGCGYGENCMWYASRGADSVVGVDISQKMIAEAKSKYATPIIEYLCHPLEDYAYPSDTFDIVISSMALHYISDFDAVVTGAYQTLKPGGIFVFSQEHPMVSARQTEKGWVNNDRGEKQFWPVDNYHELGQRKDTGWLTGDSIKYHRTIETMATSLINAGFEIGALREPGRDDPANDSHRRPPIIVFQGKKTNG